jgi:hypothetical protein
MAHHQNARQNHNMRGGNKALKNIGTTAPNSLIILSSDAV